MTKLISFGKYRNKSVELLIEDKGYCKWLLEQKTLRIKYKKDFDLIENNNKVITNNKLEELDNINFWDLPWEVIVYILNFNKRAEKAEFSSNIYNHINGKVRIYKSLRVKEYYWLNCVSCGTKLSDEKLSLEQILTDEKYRKTEDYTFENRHFEKSNCNDITEYAFLMKKKEKRNTRHYHWCYKCFTKYSPFYFKNGKRYERKDKAEGVALRSRPLLLGRDKCPLIVNDQLVLKSLDSNYQRLIADFHGDYYENGELIE